MIEEDPPARKKPGHDIGQDLSQLAIAEIDERVALLEAEIVRLREARVLKLRSQAAADALFKR